jgi:hypothetical protein
MRAAVAVALLPFLGCATAQPGGWRIDGPARELVHVSSGFRFPVEQQGCQRVNPHAYDEAGENVSVGYGCSDPKLWLTIYLYPTWFGGAPDPLEHFKMVVSDALAHHEYAQVDRAVEMPLPLGTRTVEGFNAFLQWSEDGRQVGSFVVLIPDGTRFVKVRTSVVLDESGASIRKAWELTLAVLRSVLPPA